MQAGVKKGSNAAVRCCLPEPFLAFLTNAYIKSIDWEFLGLNEEVSYTTSDT